jgi:AraC-like DNA-binding protein
VDTKHLLEYRDITMPPSPLTLTPADHARRDIARELDAFLRATRVRRVVVAEADPAPPVLAYVTPFPRLSIPLVGEHAMEVAHAARARVIRPGPGDAVFVPTNAWNRPAWRTPVTVLTLLFGAKQIGVSLVRHAGGRRPMRTLKANVHAPPNGMLWHLLHALRSAAADDVADRAQDQSRRTAPRLLGLLIESLLHASLTRLAATAADAPQKAERTYESICLYVQEHYAEPLSRESVARHFSLASTHVSRLFRHQGLMRFTDYVNFVRADRAKFLLRTYDMPLKEIAARCGYTDVAYLCQIFKRLTTMTPTQYRITNRRRRASDPR